MHDGKLTVITSDRAMGKRFELADGALTWQVTMPGAPAWGAWGRLTPAALADLLGRVKQNTIVRCGTPAGIAAGERFGVLVKSQVDDPAARDDVRRRYLLADAAVIVAATVEVLQWRTGTQWILIDFDAKGRPGPPLTARDLLALLEEAIPALRGAPVVVCASSSTHLFAGEQQLVGVGGWHVWVLIDDGAQAPSVIDAMYVLSAAAGHAWGFVSKAGDILERTIVDLAMGVPIQPAFVGGARCVAPLVQRRPSPLLVRPDAPPLCAAQVVAAARAAQAQARVHLDAACSAPDLLARAQEVRQRRLADGAPVPLRVAGAWPGDRRARPVYDFSDPTWTIHLDRGRWGTAGWRTVSELLADPSRYDGATCADPLEPHYGGTPGAPARNKGKLDLGSPGQEAVLSQAHGGRVFRLRAPDAMLAGVQAFDAPAPVAYDAQPAPAGLLRTLPTQPLPPPYPSASPAAVVQSWQAGAAAARKALLGLRMEEIIHCHASGAVDVPVHLYVATIERAKELGLLALASGPRVRVIFGRQSRHWLHGTPLCKKPRTVTDLARQHGEVRVTHFVCNSRTGGGACPHIRWCDERGYRSQLRTAFGGAAERNLTNDDPDIVISTLAALPMGSPGDIERAIPAIAVVESSAGLGWLRGGSGFVWTDEEIDALPGARRVVEWVDAGADPTRAPKRALRDLRQVGAVAPIDGLVIPSMSDGRGEAVSRATKRTEHAQVRRVHLARELIDCARADALPKVVRTSPGVVEIHTSPELERLRGMLLLVVAGYAPLQSQPARLVVPGSPPTPWEQLSALPLVRIVQMVAVTELLAPSRPGAVFARIAGALAAVVAALHGQGPLIVAPRRTIDALRATAEQASAEITHLLGAVHWRAPGLTIDALPPGGSASCVVVIDDWHVTTQAREAGAAGQRGPASIERVFTGKDGTRHALDIRVGDTSLESSDQYRFDHVVQAALAAARAPRVLVTIGRRPVDARLGWAHEVTFANEIIPASARTAFDLALAILACGGVDQVTDTPEAAAAMRRTARWAATDLRDIRHRLQRQLAAQAAALADIVSPGVAAPESFGDA